MEARLYKNKSESKRAGARMYERDDLFVEYYHARYGERRRIGNTSAGWRMIKTTQVLINKMTDHLYCGHDGYSALDHLNLHTQEPPHVSDVHGVTPSAALRRASAIQVQMIAYTTGRCRVRGVLHRVVMSSFVSTTCNVTNTRQTSRARHTTQIHMTRTQHIRTHATHVRHDTHVQHMYTALT